MWSSSFVALVRNNIIAQSQVYKEMMLPGSPRKGGGCRLTLFEHDNNNNPVQCLCDVQVLHRNRHDFKTSLWKKTKHSLE